MCLCSNPYWQMESLSSPWNLSWPCDLLGQQNGSDGVHVLREPWMLPHFLLDPTTSMRTSQAIWWDIGRQHGWELASLSQGHVKTSCSQVGEAAWLRSAEVSTQPTVDCRDRSETRCNQNFLAHLRSQSNNNKKKLLVFKPLNLEVFFYTVLANW